MAQVPAQVSAQVPSQMPSQVSSQVSSQMSAQVSRVNRQKSFRHSVPAGNYSGITHIDGNRYAIVSDKAPEMGFFLFNIQIDSLTGQLQHVVCERFVSLHEVSHDEEAIAYLPERETLFLVSEASTTIRECTLDGTLTGRHIRLQMYDGLGKNKGLESLSYQASTQRFWTCNEAAPILIQAFDKAFNPVNSFSYTLDAPSARRNARYYAHGVSELLALDDGSLLVLEREFFVPKRKVGAWVVNKLYQIGNDYPQTPKHLVFKWKTRLNLTRRSLANYEGMCLGPRLADGRQVVILVSDSQNQYAGLLRDYFKTIVL